jgi:hypothetical protein
MFLFYEMRVKTEYGKPTYYSNCNHTSMIGSHNSINSLYFPCELHFFESNMLKVQISHCIHVYRNRNGVCRLIVRIFWSSLIPKNGLQSSSWLSFTWWQNSKIRSQSDNSYLNIYRMQDILTRPKKSVASFTVSLNLSSSNHPNFVIRQTSWIRDTMTKFCNLGPLEAR